MKKLKAAAAKAKGKHENNTISPPHIKTGSLAVISQDDATELLLSSTKDGAGLWISDVKNPLHGVAVYKSNGQMAVGVRSGKGTLAAALSADPISGEGLLQLTTADGSVEVLTATEIVNVVRSLSKVLPAQAVAPKKVAKPKAAPIRTAKKSTKKKAPALSKQPKAPAATEAIVPA